ncbi:MAG: hypothetical protein JXO48_02420 [Deltaproteobacteria bacterium]|nr:hypothetical protein [Deltaproteobacteria bacterium]
MFRKHNIFIYLIVFIIPVFLSPPVLHSMQTQQGNAITILSDRLDAYEDDRLVVFSGNVVVNRDDVTMKSDSLYLYYSDEQGGTPDTVRQGITENSAIERIEARGNVEIRQGEKLVRGNNALFSNRDQTITVTGDVVMQEGTQVIQGERMIIFLSENRGTVESSDGKRVRATIYPAQENESGGKSPEHDGGPAQ